MAKQFISFLGGLLDEKILRLNHRGQRCTL